MRHVYLDNNATTPVRREVVEAMLPYFTEDFGNASSIHYFGQRAKAALDDARAQVASLIGAERSEIVFLSGGTEADNLALRGIAGSAAPDRRHLIVSAIEHSAILGTCRDLASQGFEVTHIPVDGEGRVDPADVQSALRPETLLISVMHANNEIGTLQPIEEIGRIAREARVWFHSDGVQATGKIPVDVSALGVHLYSMSSHKIHGPKGVGALYVRKSTPLKSILTGGGHERNRRSGTENVPGIVGFGTAARIARATLAEEMPRLAALRNRMEAALRDRIPDITINAERAERLPNTSNIMVTYAEGEGMLISLDLKGIAVSTGSACSSGSMEPSHVLTAIGKTPDEGFGSLRISFGAMTTDADVDALVAELPPIVGRLRSLSPHYSVRQ
jgi:cysteine desulfurase